MANEFTKQENINLIHVAEILAQIAVANPAYGLGKATTDAISAEAVNLAKSLSDQAEAEAALRAIIDAKGSARATMIARLSSTAKGLEANPAISDGMLRAASLSARPAKGVRPTALFAPTDLAATGTSDGALTLKWTSPNRTRVSHVVEISANGLDWSYLTTTMRTGFSALGFPAGQPIWARVFAVNSTLSSPASNVASLYAPVPAAAQLKVA